MFWSRTSGIQQLQDESSAPKGLRQATLKTRRSSHHTQGSGAAAAKCRNRHCFPTQTPRPVGVYSFFRSFTLESSIDPCKEPPHRLRSKHPSNQADIQACCCYPLESSQKTQAGCCASRRVPLLNQAVSLSKHHHFISDGKRCRHSAFDFIHSPLPFSRLSRL